MIHYRANTCNDLQAGADTQDVGGGWGGGSKQTKQAPEGCRPAGLLFGFSDARPVFHRVAGVSLRVDCGDMEETQCRLFVISTCLSLAQSISGARERVRACALARPCLGDGEAASRRLPGSGGGGFITLLTSV